MVFGLEPSRSHRETILFVLHNCSVHEIYSILGLKFLFLTLNWSGSCNMYYVCVPFTARLQMEHCVQFHCFSKWKLLKLLALNITYIDQLHKWGFWMIDFKVLMWMQFSFLVNISFSRMFLSLTMFFCLD